jgi:hypothetical protein
MPSHLAPPRGGARKVEILNSDFCILNSVSDMFRRLLRLTRLPYSGRAVRVLACCGCLASSLPFCGSLLPIP